MLMLKNVSNGARKFSLIAALAISVAFNLKAQSGSENYGSIDLAQGNSAITGTQSLLNNACAPTATANGLAYLYSLDPGDFSGSPDNYTTVNQLITAMGTTTAGTTGANAISGLNSYLSANAPGITAVQNTDPTAQAIANALNADQAVQIGILWGDVQGSSSPYTFAPYDSGGGHFLSVTAINMSGSSGTMTVLDPWGALGTANAGTTATTVTLSVQTYTYTGIGTVLQLYYPAPPFVGPEDTTLQNSTGASEFGGIQQSQGYIALDDIEAVPEPTTVSLFVGGALALLAYRRWKA